MIPITIFTNSSKYSKLNSSHFLPDKVAYLPQMIWAINKIYLNYDPTDGKD